MRRRFVICLALIGCNSSEDPAAKAPRELCIAANQPEHLIEVNREGTTSPITARMELSIRDLRLDVPNGEALVRNARGETVKIYFDGKNTETVRVDFDFYKTDKLCLYYRPATGLSNTGGWKMDSAANTPRCQCWKGS